MYILSINDEWSYRLQARLMTIAVSRNQIPRLPWKLVLFGTLQKLEGVPETVELAEVVIAFSRNVRAAAMKLLDGYSEPLTFADMKKIMSAQEESLLSLDRFFALDVHFLKEVAQPMAESIVRDWVLAALPDHDNFIGFTLEKSIAKLDEVKGRSLVKACGPAMFKELCAIVQLL